MRSGLGNPTRRFSLVVGGPFHDVLLRLGLIADDGLPRGRVAVALAALAWVPPALLVVAQSLLDDGYSGWGFFSDATVFARYMVAISMMVATERYADRRLNTLIQQFRIARLIADGHESQFAAALAVADRRSSSNVAEAVIFAAAIAFAAWSTRYAVVTASSTWEGSVVDGETVLSWAGTVASWVSTPLFLFLVLRWLWRFAVWTTLLYRFARLPLQLTPMHPDRSAGLGFLSIYPSIFTGFVFALSCVVAASVLKELSFVDLSNESIRWMLGGWLAVVVVLFLGPLSVFVPVLHAARETALLDYGRLTSQHHLAFHRKWINAERSGEELMGSADPSSASDLNASVQAALALRVFPVDRFALIQLLAASGIPLLAVVLSQVPLVELGKRIGLGIL